MWSKPGLEMVYIERPHGLLMSDSLIWLLLFKGVLCDYNQKHFKFFTQAVNCSLACSVVTNHVVLSGSSV